MRNKVLVFTERGIRWIYTDNTDQFKGASNVLVNPDTSLVKNIKPRHWKIENGKVAPMSESERAERDALLESDPKATTEVIEVVRWKTKEVPVPVEKVVEVEKEVPKTPWWVHVGYAAALGVAAAILEWLK